MDVQTAPRPSIVGLSREVEIDRRKATRSGISAGQQSHVVGVLVITMKRTSVAVAGQDAQPKNAVVDLVFAF